MCGAGVYSYQKRSDGWYYELSNGWHYDRQRIPQADPQSFHILPGPGSDLFYNPCARDSGYAVDKAHVYRRATVLRDADPATFSLLDYGYSHDATHVYYMEEILSNADARTFQKITPGSFFKDSSHVFLNGVAIKNADPATFSPIGDNSYPGKGLARDRKHVFWGASEIAGADPRDAKPLGRWYWSSRQTIYLEDHPLLLADFATFKAAGDEELAYSAEDKEHYFLGGRALDKSECRKVGRVVLACKGYILASGRKYSRVDSSSLHYLGMFPRMCQVMQNGLIYQDNRGIYEFYGDGTIMKFLGFEPDRQYETLDKALEDRLCDCPGTQSLIWDK